jgi:hypothetical protein
MLFHLEKKKIKAIFQLILMKNLASFSQEPVAACTLNVSPPPGIIVSCCAYNFITSYPQGHGIIQTIAVSRCFDCQQPASMSEALNPYKYKLESK